MNEEALFTPARYELLEKIYSYYTHPQYISPDPLQMLFNYRERRDIEVVVLISASFAYGRVAAILSTLNFIFEVLMPAPCKYLLKSSKEELAEKFAGFKYRFTTDTELVDMLYAIKCILEKFDTLENCFLSVLEPSEPDYSSAMKRFSALIYEYGAFSGKSSLIPMPQLSSASKRLAMFLRWMIRHDEVDLGLWDRCNPKALIVPLDTHMHSVAKRLGFTKSKTGSMRTAQEITHGFALFSPEDPVKYDFALTRSGIRGEDDVESLLAAW